MTSHDSLDRHYAQLREKCEREDLVMFINACFAATGQNEYYSDRFTQSVSIDFLHLYVLGNYRKVYARSLAAGVNQFNQLTIVFNLLRAGAPADAALRHEEGQLIAAAIQALPANRVYGLFQRLRREQVNNRRSRAVVRDYLAGRRTPAFDAVKYRTKLRIIARHSHLRLPDETGKFLFDLERQKRFETPLYDSFLRARYSQQAVFELPMTVAEGLAERHGISRKDFLRRIEPQMTLAEKRRLQNASLRETGKRIKIDFARTPLTQLAMYVLSLPLEERLLNAETLHQALTRSAEHALRKFPLRLPKVALVLDRSRSTWGSREKRRRPLAVAVAVDYLVQTASPQTKTFWTPATNDRAEATDQPHYPFLRDSGGQTDLATPLLEAIRWRPDQIILVSDGYENSPPDAAQQIIVAYRERLAQQHPISFVHANPVFDPDHFSPHRLGDSILTIGLRDAEDLGASLGFAKFAAGEASLQDLENQLGKLVAEKLANAQPSRGPIPMREDQS